MCVAPMLSAMDSTQASLSAPNSAEVRALATKSGVAVSQRLTGGLWCRRVAACAPWGSNQVCRRPRSAVRRLWLPARAAGRGADVAGPSADAAPRAALEAPACDTHASRTASESVSVPFLRWRRSATRKARSWCPWISSAGGPSSSLRTGKLRLRRNRTLPFSETGLVPSSPL